MTSDFQPGANAAPERKVHCLAVCVNIHCAMNGAEDLVDHLVIEHGIAPDVVSARNVTLELTHCFAACELGPNVEIDGNFYDGVTVEQLDELLAGLD